MATAVLVAGLGFGDEGKGTTVDYLCAERNADLVVRYNGGAQAAHNVVTANGKHHTFSQIGSGFFQGADTYLSKYMLIDPVALVEEAKKLSELSVQHPLHGLHVDRMATVITPYHRAANRIQETMRGDSRHGSCGVGVGEARRDELDGFVLKMGEVINRPNTIHKLVSIQLKKFEELPEDWKQKGRPEDVKLMLSKPDEWADTYQKIYKLLYMVDENFLLGERFKKSTIIFEGAQGVLLDENYGFYPYNSWTNTTFDNAEKILRDIGFSGIIEKCGVLRTYMTRHGAGPFPSEGMLSVAADGKKRHEHNVTGPWQGAFRTGWLDLVLLRYAAEICDGLDYLSVTHMDCCPRKVCWGYSGTKKEFFTNEARLDPKTRSLEEMEKLSKHLFEVKAMNDADFSLDIIERNLGAPVRLESYGPTCRDKKLRSKET